MACWPKRQPQFFCITCRVRDQKAKLPSPAKKPCLRANMRLLSARKFIDQQVVKNTSVFESERQLEKRSSRGRYCCPNRLTIFIGTSWSIAGLRLGFEPTSSSDFVSGTLGPAAILLLRMDSKFTGVRIFEGSNTF